MAAFHYEQYRNPYVGSLSDLIMRPAEAQAAAAERIGQIQGQAIQQSGQAWAGAAQNTGQAITGAIQQATDPKRQLEAEQLKNIKDGEVFTKQINGLISKGGLIGPEGTVDRAKLGAAMAQSNIPMAMQEQTFKTLDNVEGSIQKFKSIKVDHLADIAHAALQDPHGQTPEGFMVLAGLAKANGLATDADLAPIGAALANGADPKALLGSIRSMSEKYKDVNKPVIIPRPGAIATTPDAIAAAGGSMTAPEPAAKPTEASLALEAAGGDAAGAMKILKPAPKAANAQSESFLLDGKPVKGAFVPDATGGKYLFNGEDVTSRVKPIPPASTIVNTGKGSDVDETVAGMMDGTLPPVLPGRATKEYTALLAAAHRKGYELAAAATDWAATQKHISTMNGAQQLRLSQSINALPDMLDKVDALASQWKGGRFPLLNKGNLIAAKNGTYGEEVASVARQLETQIADVTSDLGNVYMGGNSPTDHALKLAGTALASDWSEKVLHDMVKLAKGNVTIRSNSMKNTGVAGASPNNPYAAPAAPVGETWVRDANGKLVKK